MKSTKLFFLLFTLWLLFTINSSVPALAGNNAFGIEMHSDSDIILFADYYLSDVWMLHPWFVPNGQSNILVRYAAPIPGFTKFELGGGPTWATENDVEKLRYLSGELDFQLELGHGVAWQSYNLGQWATDGNSSDSGLLRQQLKFDGRRLGVFNENRLKQRAKPQSFVGLYYNLAPLKFLSTCKLVCTVNLNNGNEYFVAWIAEF